MTELRSLPVPIPPTQEQERILEALNKLLALCDELEAQIEGRNKIAEEFAISISYQIAA